MVEIQSQVKGVINIVLTIIIAVFVGLLPTSSWYCIGIIISGAILIILLFIPSREENFYQKEIGHMEKMKDLDRKLDEKSKKVKYSKKMQKLNQTAKEFKEKISKGEVGTLTDFYFKLNKSTTSKL